MLPGGINYLKYVGIFVFISCLSGCYQGSKIEFHRGDRVAIVGNGLAERMQHDGWLETYLQAAFPKDSLVFRNLGYSGDQVHYRPRAHEGFGSSDKHLTDLKASVIFAFFGYNESFENDPEEFREQLNAWIDHTRSQSYDSIEAPRIFLFSPIAHENLNTHNLPDGSTNNERLEKYTQVMSEVALDKQVTFIDLFGYFKKAYLESAVPLTINGVHLNELGNRKLAEYFTHDVLGTEEMITGVSLDSLRNAVVDKNRLWFNRYRTTSGNDVWGIRSSQDGNYETLQNELKMLDVMAANRDRQIWARAHGGDLVVDDSNVPQPIAVGTHITRTVDYIDPVAAIDRMTVPPDLQVNLFAAEDKFPEIINPVAMQVDTRGRIWVASWGTYPKWQPGTPMNDRLVFLTDENNDGEADKATTFAYVSHPTGFEFWNDGVIVVSAPDILYLKDTTGDGVADVKQRLFGGIGSDDTHHTANNLIYGPDGNIYYQRGIFILENIETPWRRSEESGSPGLYRFNPRTFDFSYVVENTPNSHGISFDKWGNQYITDGTSGRAFQVYYKRTVTSVSDVNEFDKRPLFKQTIRPLCANQILSSAHFPEEYQNNFLIYNVIGFQGIKRYRLDYQGAGVVKGTEAGDLVYTGDDPTFNPNSEAQPRAIPAGYTGDPNFRPTDGVIGADGALYFSDWQNAVITHSPYNLRDISRDQAHGRIYRISAKNRPLQQDVAIYGQPIPELLEHFRSPVDGIRHQVRIELSGRDTEEVIAAAREWVSKLDPGSADDALPMLEVLWLHQQHNIKNEALLNQVLQSPVEQARIAAQKVAWFWSDRSNHKRGATDATVSGMQFRTFYEPFWTQDDTTGVGESLAVAEEQASKPTDDDLPPSQRVVLETKGVGPVKDLEISGAIDLELAIEGREIFNRNCISCHITDQKLVGPPLKGILERRSPEWIMNMIINPTEMLAKDALAKELLAEFKDTPMIDEGISEAQARALLEYFRSL